MSSVHKLAGGVLVLAFGSMTAPIALGQEVLFELSGTRHSVLGTAVAALPDLDGDGVTDFAVGAPGYRNRRGLVLVFSGRTQKRLLRIVGPEPPWHANWFGSPLGSVGDVNGDGVADLLIGNHSDDDPFGNNGSVQVHSGADGVLIHRVEGTDSGIQLGLAVTGLDDVNGDSVPDFAASSALGSFVQVYSGLDAAPIYRLGGAHPDDLFGMAIANVGDLDGDGVSDLAVGATRAYGAQPGYVRFHSGLTGSLLRQVDGDLDYDYFGFSVVSLPDRTGDGIAEILVGAPGNSADGRGYARILSGADGATVATLNSPEIGDRFGHAVADAGDVNGDGWSDLLVCAPYGDYAEGRAVLYSGASLAVLYRIRGSGDDLLGIAAAGLGDLDGDGLGEVVVGVPWAEPTGVETQGAVQVYRGNDLYLDPSAREVGAGDALSLATREGAPGNPLGLFLTSVDGAGVFLLVSAGQFDSAGSFAVAGAVPPGLSGRVLRFRSIAVGSGGLIDSIDEPVSFR